MKRCNDSFRLLAAACLLAASLCLARSTRAADAPAVTPAERGFRSMFNGQDLRGWQGNTNLWSVEDGVITGRTTKETPAPHNTFLLWRGGRVSNFILRFSYRVIPGDDQGFANSGVQYRSKVTDRAGFVMAGYQADIEAGPTYTGTLYDEAGGAGGRGTMAQRGETVRWGPGGKQVLATSGTPRDLQAVIKTNDWNDYEITVEGWHFVHKINGVTMIDLTDDDPAKRVANGFIGLQLHAGPPMTVQFKNLRIKRQDRKIVFVAGTPSHGPGDHEHRADCLLLRACLDPLPGLQTVVVTNGWPRHNNTRVFNGAAAIVLDADGGDGNPFIQDDRLEVLGRLMQRRVGLGCIHYAVEVPKDRGGPEFLEWIGGYFETFRSVNPTWEAEFTSLPQHPVTRGVHPFKINDEWYYHMRFPDGLANVTPILTAVPPDRTRGQPGVNDAHGGNPEVQKHKGEPEHMMWVIQRPDGGRGFGFTGGHFHRNFGNADFRKVVLNAILWIARVEVPPEGVPSEVTPDQLQQNLDPKGR